jgi:hypothetical protein
MEDQVPQSERRSGPRRKAPGKATPSTPRGGGDGKTPIEPATGQPRSGHSRNIEVESEAATAPGAKRRPLGSPADEGAREREFDLLASESPLAAVFGALAIGIAVGFILGRMAWKD